MHINTMLLVVDMYKQYGWLLTCIRMDVALVSVPSNQPEMAGTDLDVVCVVLVVVRLD